MFLPTVIVCFVISQQVFLYRPSWPETYIVHSGLELPWSAEHWDDRHGLACLVPNVECILQLIKTCLLTITCVYSQNCYLPRLDRQVRPSIVNVSLKQFVFNFLYTVIIPVCFPHGES